jgi:hypothetical protein
LIQLAMEPPLKKQVEQIHRETKDVRTKERAQVFLSASQGHAFLSADCRDTVVRASSTVRQWIDRFCDQGPDALIYRQGQGGGRPSPIRHADVQQAIEQNLKERT